MGAEILKKQWTKGLSLLFIVVLIISSIPIAVFGNEDPTETNKNESLEEKIIDTDEVSVFAKSEETDDEIQWIIRFEKKANEEKAGRIRLTLDYERLDESAVVSVSGTGLEQEGEALLTEEFDDRPWFVGKKYDTEKMEGSLIFLIRKDRTEGWDKIPLDVSVDYYKVSQIAPVDYDLNSLENLNPLKRLEKNKEMSTVSLLDLGPGAYSDPYRYLPNGTQQNRYPELTTNDYTKRTGSGNYPYQNSGYTGSKGSAYNGNTLINDSNYAIGGANWRNFNYTSNYTPAAGQASTIQLWGGNRNFENSYLNYNGAFIKKWIEPIANTGNEEDNTTNYNVYLDVIGGSIPLKKKLDVVLVLDKSNSMTATGGDNIPRDTALRASVERLVNDMFANSSIDLRMGMVSFYSDESGGTQDPNNRNNIRSDENRDYLTSDKNRLLNSTYNPALYSAPRGGTPTALGLRKGYEMLYWDGSDREKVLILISDGCPTFHYEGVQYTNGTDYNGSGYYSYDLGNTLFRNYESNYTGRDFNNNYAESNFSANLKYPTDFTRPYGSFIRGEVQDSDNKVTHWAGFGGQGYFDASIKPGAYNTVAYQRWLNNVKGNGIYKDTKVFTLGIGVNPRLSGLTDYQRVQNAVGTNVLKNMADKKANGEPAYYDTNRQDELTSALQEIATSITQKTLINGTIIDDLGDNVSLSSEPSVEYFYVPVNTVASPPYLQPVTWNDYQHGSRPQISLSRNGKRVSASQITLGASEMIRIKYQVKLDTHDGKFYTANNQAYLSAPSLSGNMYFPSPSIRYLEEVVLPKKLQLELQKRDVSGRVLPGVEFELRQGSTVVAKGTSDNSGRVKFSKPDNTSFILEVGEYQLYETNAPEGIIIPSTHWIIQHLANGNVQYRSSDSFNWIPLSRHTVSSEIELVEFDIINQRINELEEQDVSIYKTDENGSPLNGAVFQLSKTIVGVGNYYAITGDLNDPLSPPNGVGNFYEAISVNTITHEYILNYSKPFVPEENLFYEISELKAPPGYTASQETAIINLFNSTGVYVWHVLSNQMFVPLSEGVPWESPNKTITLMIRDEKLRITYINKKNPIDLTLSKKDGNGNSLNGAAFDMFVDKGSGWETYTPGLTATPVGGSEFKSTNLEPGKYKIVETRPPDGYQLLSGHIILEVVRQSSGALTAKAYHYPKPDTDPTTYEDLLAQVDTSGNTVNIKFDVDNFRDPVPLPNTGGMGKRMYFLIALSIVLATLIPGSFLYLRTREKEK